MNTKPLTDLQSAILSIITKRTKLNPVNSYELMEMVNLRDKDNKKGANLRAVVNSLRDKGYSVCANSVGYYAPQSPAELKEYIDSFQNRIDQQQIACDVLKERLQMWEVAKRKEERLIGNDGQIKLF